MTGLQRALLSWYAREGRKSLPWRSTRDPYRVLVSEFMLQQTQVERVVPKYRRFVKTFPTFRSLASASTAQVIRAWKGLGYNTRAVRLRQLAEEVITRYGGTLPEESRRLQKLPGIGPYTAAALRAFAFGKDDLAIDVNVRRVTHRLMHGAEVPPRVSSAELERDARAAMPKGHGHGWNSALMDLGALVCTGRAPQCGRCPVQTYCAAAPLERETLAELRRRHTTRRSGEARLPFARTTRFARGRIVDRLRELPAGRQISLLDLRFDLQTVLREEALDALEPLLFGLERDGVVQRDGDRFALRD
jgi:A/G-specific adenine glycosylase